MKETPRFKIKLFEDSKYYLLEKKINNFIKDKDIIDVSIETQESLFFTNYLGVVKYR